MKKQIVLYYMLLMAAITINAPQAEFPELTGLYFGQKPPGMTPEIFAPGIVSAEESEEYFCLFWNNGTHLLFLERVPVIWNRIIKTFNGCP